MSYHSIWHNGQGLFFSFQWMTHITGMHEKAWGKSSSKFSLLYISTNIFSNSKIMLLPTNTKTLYTCTPVSSSSSEPPQMCLQPPTTNFWMWTQSSPLSMSTFPHSAQQTTDGYRIKYVSCNPYGLEENVVDSIHAQSPRLDKYGKVIPGWFDTGLMNYKNGRMTSVEGHCVGRVRCVFTLPLEYFTHTFSHLVGGRVPPKYLPNVEWFTPFPISADQNHLLYKISKLQVHSKQQVSIVPVQLIHQSVHLFPKFGAVAQDEWKSTNVLNLCQIFSTNPFSDHFPYSNLY